MKDSAKELSRLMEVVETLRGPNGCPWDQEQSLEDVGRHLLEEAGEVLDAIEDGEGHPTPEVCEELGDVLMNVFMASVIAGESQAFELAAIAAGIREKLIRRHPHVFSDREANNSEEVLKLWNAIKDQEKADRGESATASRLSAVPRNLPPVLRAEKLSGKAAKAGFDWEAPEGVIGKLKEEIEELERAMEAAGSDPAGKDRGVMEELGDILFTAVNLCRKLDVSADAALRQSTAKFVRRFMKLEKILADLESADAEEMNRAWEQEKGEGAE